MLSFAWLYILVIKLQIWYFCDFQIGMSQPLNGALRFKWRLTRNTSFYSPETGSLQISREEQELPAVSLLQAGDYAAGTASVAALTDLRPAVGRIPPRWAIKENRFDKEKIGACLWLVAVRWFHFQEPSQNMLLPVFTRFIVGFLKFGLKHRQSWIMKSSYWSDSNNDKHCFYQDLRENESFR